MVWNSMYIPSRTYASFYLDWDRWLCANLFQCSSLSMNIPWNILFTFICWHIWKWRCKCIFDSSFNLPYNMRAIILAYIDDWTTSSRKNKKSCASQFISLHWAKPPAGTMKINVDGTLNSNGRIGAGGIMRDHNGTWCGGFMTNLGTSDILQAEAWGIFFGLQLSINAGVQLVKFESDFANLVNLLSAEDVSLHPLGTVLANCKMLSSNFISCSTRHVHREVNSIADILAKASLAKDKGIIWLDAAPATITDAVQADIAGATKIRRISALIPFCSTSNAAAAAVPNSHEDHATSAPVLLSPAAVTNVHVATANVNVEICNSPIDATDASLSLHMPPHGLV